MCESKYENEKDLIYITKYIYQNKKFIFKTILISFVCGIIIAYSLPTKYTVNIVLSPEANSNNANNNIAGVANMLGINNIGNNNKEAINSYMFPEIISSTPFILELYDLSVKTKEGNYIKLNEYIATEKTPWWNYIIQGPIIGLNLIKNSISNSNNKDNVNNINNLQIVTKQQNEFINYIKSSLTAKIDESNNMTIISATFQDPIISTIVADTAISKLQKYIINYRTQKAQEDFLYIKKLCDERKKEYYTKQQIYADFTDSNKNIISQKTRLKSTFLENDMQLAYQIYSQTEAQLQNARAKIQEAKPVFAIIEPAIVPLTPTSPNKKLIILAFIVLSTMGSITWLLFAKELVKKFQKVNI